MVYLVMETRTGKTPVSIYAASQICEERGCSLPILFLTKKSVIDGINDTYSKLSEQYEIIKRHKIEVHSIDSIHKIEHINNRVIIIDEAHSFGAYPKPSRRAIMLAGLARGCTCILLSATPTPESYSQIYHQLWAVGATHKLVAGYKNFYQWAKKYVDIREKYVNVGVKVKDYSRAKEDMIKSALEDIAVSITQREANFKYHTVDEQIIRIPMPDEIKQMIKAIRDEGIILDFMGTAIIAETAASEMSKIHQLCSGTVIADDGNRYIVSTHKSDKLPFIRALYGKIAIYYKYVAERDAIMSVFGDDVTESPVVFEKSVDKVFVGQFLSKREGINLFSADAIVFYNIDFAYVSYIQTKNRIMNITRSKIPAMVLMFTDGGIESQIYNVVQKKKNYTESFYKGEKTWQRKQ